MRCVNEPVTWTIPELTDWVNAVISQTLGGDIWVEGEITNIQRSSSGHVYFTLIEAGADTGSAPHTLAVTLFKWHRQYVNNHLKRSGGSVRMDNGVRVRIKGAVEIYGPRSQLQLKMTGIDPAFTLGTIMAERDLLLRTLATEGLLDADRLRSIPSIPERVVLITSLGSAAHADFCHEIERGGIGFDLTTIDTRVQGADAAAMLCRALLLAAATRPDLIAIVRGGGATTDLAAFDHELVARAIATCGVAVWCGIGHETDRTVTDSVAHSAFKTPTACAAAVVEHARGGIDEMEERWSQICDAAADRLDGAERRVNRAGTRAATLTRDRFEMASSRLRLSTHRLFQDCHHHLARAEARLDGAGRVVATAPPRHLTDAERRIDAMAATVRAYDPANVVARGYSITRTVTGDLARADDLTPGDELVTVLSDGIVSSTVLAIGEGAISG